MFRGKKINVNAVARALCIIVVLTAMTASTALAQTPAQAESRARRAQPTPTISGKSDDPRMRDSQQSASGTQPDLSITARVTARELRFEKVPNPTVEFTGQPKRETVWTSERENLPDEVQPGVTYRNIGITLRITSVFADIDRIVAEALGEIPTNDGAQPQGTAPQSPVTPPATSQAVASPATLIPAPQADAQPISATGASTANAVTTTRRTPTARKGRGN